MSATDEHVGQVENSFLSGVYRARCSCGWTDDVPWRKAEYAQAAAARHVKNVKALRHDTDGSHE